MRKTYKMMMLAMVLAIISIETYAGTGEVTKSGSTWTTKVDGTTRYTGTDMLDAIEAGCYWAGSGTIHVRASGTVDAPNGLRSVNIRSNQTIDFHGNSMHCNNDYQVFPVKGYKRSNIAVKNLHVTGKPRYVLHFAGCNDITLTNITSNLANGQGIRFEDGSNMTMNGNINLKTGGHSIESMRFNDIYMGKVTVESEFGCGVLFNTSENCNVDEIRAYNCNPGGSYAGFRQANNNGKTYCGFLYARNCGRGLYTLTGSHDVTVNKVDIANCTQSGISPATTARNVKVNSGTVSNTPKAIDIWNGASGICIKVNGGSYGDACGGSGGGSGSYARLSNRNSGMCLTSNNSNISQYSCSSSNTGQQFELVDAGSGYVFLKNRKNGKCIRATGGSTVVQETCNNSYWTMMFSRQSVGSGYYLIKNRNTSTCLRIGNGSGNNAYMSGCNSSYWSEQFYFTSVSSREGEEDVLLAEETGVSIYPNPASDEFTITLPTGQDGGSYQIVSSSGSLLSSDTFSGNSVEVDASDLAAGLYVVIIKTSDEVIKKVLSVK